MAEIAKGIIDIEINTGSAASQLQALQAQINAFNLALNKNNKSQGTFAAKYAAELQAAINKTGMFTAETIRLSTAASTLDKTLSKGKTSLGQFFSAKFNKDSAIAAETMSLAAERARRLQTQFIATSGAANGFQDALAVRPLAAFSSEAAVAAQRTQLLSNMFKQGTTQLINFGKNVQWAGRQLMVGFTVPLTIFGAVAGKTFMELEKQVVGFKKVYGDLFTTPADLEKNLEAVKGLAGEYTKYGIAVKDTIGLAAQAAAAGRQGAELTDSVTQATRLATLGQMDQNAALETTISLQSAFKLSGQDLADTINFLNMVENQTVVSLQDIAAAIPRVAPVISGLGGDVKDLTVFLAAMQEGGVDAAEGANALKSGLASLINPTKQATAMLSGMGINLETIIQTNKGDLMGTVQSFAQALGALDQFSRQQALEQVFGKFQYAKLGALFENITREGSQAQQVIATLGYTTEQLASTADKELKTIEESFGVQLTGAVERFKLAIAPIGEIFVKLAIPLVNLATKIAEAFNGLSDGQKKFAAIGAVVIGIVVPAVTMLTGLFLNLVGTLAKMTQGASLFAKGLITGGPIGAMKALTQSSKYLSLAEMDAAMAAQQLAGSNEILNATLLKQVTSANGAAGAIGNLTRAYAAMISTQSAAAGLPGFAVAGAAGAAAKTSQVRIKGVRVQGRNSGGPIFMSNGTTVPGVGNTDTVPAMLTPGEFVVNKEATKNNLGLLHSINDSKMPQGLNAGGKAKGMQYLSMGAAVRAARLGNLSKAKEKALQLMEFVRIGSATADDILKSKGYTNLEKGEFKKLLNPRSSSATQIESRASVSSGRYSLGTSPVIISLLKSLRSQQKLHGGTRAIRPGSTPSRRGISESNVDAPYTDRAGGMSPSNLKILEEIFGPEEVANLVQRTSKSGTDVTGHIFGKGFTKRFPKVFGESGSAPRRTGQQQSRLGNYSSSDLEKLQGRNFDRTLDILPANMVVIPGSFNTGLGSRTASGENFSTTGVDFLTTAIHLKKTRLPDGRTVSNEAIKEVTERAASILNHDVRNFGSTLGEQSFAKLVAKAEKEAMFEILPRFGFNAGGKVPGYNAGALIGKSLRRRVRPGKEERSNQLWAFSRYIEDPKYIRENPEAMATLAGMLKPINQTTRATRGTVLGSTKNPELPYAQQKRIVAAIKEGRYEDLFGMKLNFKGPGSYTTRRETDFSPFIGDLGNPTLKSFSEGFMGLKRQKEEIAKLRKIMKSGKFKKLTPGTAEYARALGMAGWSPARSFRPGVNNPIGSDYTIEQVIANKLRDYGNTKTWVNKTFPDKKIQQLLIDEMVGSGTLALDAKKYRSTHPEIGKRRTRSGGLGGLDKIIKKENEILLGNRTSQITGVATDLRTRLPSLITQSGVQGFNRGNIVPGTGNTDTVPAMLTPGEFVINKESAKKNYDLLTAINDGQLPKFNKGGKIPGVQYLNDGEEVKKTKGRQLLPKKSSAAPEVGNSRVAGRVGGFAPMAAGLGASFIPMAMAPEMGMVGQIAASTAAYMAAQKTTQAALMKFRGQTLKAVDSTGKVGEGFKQLFPQLSKLSPKILKFAAPLTGAGVALAAVGFTLYKLNKSIVNTEKSGAELSEAMYGSAKTTKAMGEAFGRETYATTARRKAVENAGGQEISQEAVAASGEFMKSDAAKGIIEDIKLVEKSGGNAVLALRNQLTSSIIAGVISPEEARAIALDIGKELGDEKLAIKLSGELTSLIGPNGEKILDNLVEITAEITPKINSSAIAKDAQDAFDSLNPGEKFVQFFKGGKDTFIENFSIDEISAKNASALTKEAEARALLNLAVQEGTISLKEYLDAESKLNSGAKDRSSFVENANAQALGFSSTAAMQSKLQEHLGNLNVDTTGMSTLEASEAVSLGQARAREDSQGKAAYEAIVTKSKDALKQAFIEDEMDATMAESIVSEIESGIALVDPEIFDKLISGQVSLDQLPMLERMIDQGIPQEKIDSLFSNLKILESIPNIDLVVDINNPDPDEIQSLVDEYLKFESLSDIEKKAYVETNVSAEDLDRFKTSYEEIMKLPDNEIVNVTKMIKVEINYRSEMSVAAKSGDMEQKRLLQAEADKADKYVKTVLESMDKLKEEDGATLSPSVDGPGGTKEAKQTLQEYVEEFRAATREKQKYLAVTMKYLGTAKMEAVALIDQKRLLEANAMIESKNSKIRKEGKKILADLIKLAQQQLSVTRANEFLSMSAGERELQRLDLQEKALGKKANKEQEIIRNKQKEIDINNKALDEISEKEEIVNKTYDDRLKALDKVSQANDRIAQQESSRISLASALASGDIAAAATISSEIQQQEAQYRIEDARAALEDQRQKDLESITIRVNGQLLTREQIEGRNKKLSEEIEIVETRLSKIEETRLGLAKDRARQEEKILLLQQQQLITDLKKLEAANKLTGPQKKLLETLIKDFNTGAKSYNEDSPGTKGDFTLQKNYGGVISKMAFGGVAYKGSTENPPALRMNYGSTVPGVGMIDKVPALLTPGEFVVRKPVAKQYGGFLEKLNGQVFPEIGGNSQVPTNNFLDGIGSPRYSIPENSAPDVPVSNLNNVTNSSPMYNSTYNVNVNVSGTNASPDEIANVVMAKISSQNRGNLRSSKY
jgi:TP901 family phage tail tape measure protein